MIKKFIERTFGIPPENNKQDDKDLELEEIAGEIEQFDESGDKNYVLRNRKAELHFANMGFRIGNSVELKNPDGSVITGVIKKIWAAQPYNKEMDSFSIQIEFVDKNNGLSLLNTVSASMLQSNKWSMRKIEK